MTTVIAYHVEIPRDGPTGEMGRRHDRWGGREYERLLSMLADSARRAIPGCRLVFATDMDTPLNPASPWERFRKARGDYRIGVHRMVTHAAFLDSQPPGKYLFVDTDVLINRDPTELFEFDVGVCAPFPGERAKLNAGVVYVNNPRSGVEWFLTVAEAVRNLSPEEQVWMGDQFAMEIILFTPERIWRDEMTWSGHRIGVLPSMTANWSPARDHKPPDGEHAFVWHFKGPRKPRMAEFHKYLERRHDAERNGLRQGLPGHADEDGPLQRRAEDGFKREEHIGVAAQGR
jgi:hypothetical protein